VSLVTSSNIGLGALGALLACLAWIATGLRTDGVRVAQSEDAAGLKTGAERLGKRVLCFIKKPTEPGICGEVWSRRRVFSEIRHIHQPVPASVRKSTSGSRRLLASTGRWALISRIERRSSLPRLAATAASTRPPFR
jgi:hypothetical protein